MLVRKYAFDDVDLLSTKMAVRIEIGSGCPSHHRSVCGAEFRQGHDHQSIHHAAVPVQLMGADHNPLSVIGCKVPGPYAPNSSLKVPLSTRISSPSPYECTSSFVPAAYRTMEVARATSPPCRSNSLRWTKGDGDGCHGKVLPLTTQRLDKSALSKRVFIERSFIRSTPKQCDHLSHLG